jgi:hypothetical protein
MSQIIVDEHLSPQADLRPIRQWASAQRVDTLKPGEVLKDDRLLVVLTQIEKPTLITIDDDFWDKRYRDSRYCILYFALAHNQQHHIPLLLRRLLRYHSFRTKAARMGKVARITFTHVNYWQTGSDKLFTLAWLPEHKSSKS